MSTEQPQSNRLYVGNIPWSTTVEELQGLFTDAENIEIPTVRFLLSFFFCFYNFDSIALVWETKKNFSRADDSFFHRRRVSTRSLRETSLPRNLRKSFS
jgi:RNA recognition motif-containing protein